MYDLGKIFVQLMFGNRKFFFSFNSVYVFIGEIICKVNSCVNFGQRFYNQKFKDEEMLLRESG